MFKNLVPDIVWTGSKQDSHDLTVTTSIFVASLFIMFYTVPLDESTTSTDTKTTTSSSVVVVRSTISSFL